MTYLPDGHGSARSNAVMLGGMSGVGAKGALAYGLMAANMLRHIEDDDPMLAEIATAMGFERLRADLAAAAQRP